MKSVEKIARMLHRRPSQGRFREQLFWLVDVIFACKASGDVELIRHAELVEQALGRLGEYIETGDTQALAEATARVEEFAQVIRGAVAQSPSGSSGQEGEP